MSQSYWRLLSRFRSCTVVPASVLLACVAWAFAFLRKRHDDSCLQSQFVTDFMCCDNMTGSRIKINLGSATKKAAESATNAQKRKA